VIHSDQPPQIFPPLPRESLGGVIIVLVFILSRLIFIFNGGDFVAKPLAFAMQYLDPLLLKSDLLKSLFYLHSQPPIFNLFLGMVIKLSAIPSLSYELIFNTAGAVISLSFYGILMCLGINWIISLFISLVFMLNPTLILYEHLLYYSYFEVLFVSLSLFFLICWCRDKKYLNVLLFWIFLLCLGMIRSVFHPVFILVTSVILSSYLWFLVKEKRCAKVLFLSSFLALAPLSVLCLKNTLVFGFFGTSSWEGMSLWTKVNGFAPEQLEEFRDRGIISPLAVKAELRAFQQPIGNYFTESELKNIPCHHPADCNQFKSTGYPNFNHSGYVYLSKQLFMDSLALIAYAPSQFAFYTLGSYSLTLWHSSDSVHALFEKNMEVVKKLEKIYRFLYFGFLGVESKLDERMWGRTIIITILFMIIYISTLINAFKKDDRELTGIKLFCLFCLIIHAYTLTVSSVIEFGENNRFRFPVDMAFLAMTAGNIAIWKEQFNKRLKSN
jgi:hypothetical protein